MPIYQRTRASVLDALIAVCALSALASAGHSADAPPPGLPPGQPTGLPCGYEVVAIITASCPPPFGSATVHARSMNEHGEVVGNVGDCDDPVRDHAWYWSQDTGMIVLPMPPDTYTSHANDINDHGLIVGEYRLFGELWRGFIYDMKTGDFTTLEPINPDGASSSCWANAINNDGVVVGARSLGETEQPYNAFIWTPDDDDPSQGTYTDLGVMNGPHSSAIRILDSGLVLGWTGKIGGPPNKEGFTYHEGVLTLLGHPDKGLQSQTSPGDVNSRGVVVGGTLMTTFPRPTSSLPVRYTDGEWQFESVLPGCYTGGFIGISDVGISVGACLSNETGDTGIIWFGDAPVDVNEFAGDIENLDIGMCHSVTRSGMILARGHVTNTTAAVLLAPRFSPTGDLNGDCKVDGGDLSMLLGAWGDRASAADLNGDGVVDGTDLAILLGNWTE